MTAYEKREIAFKKHQLGTLKKMSKELGIPVEKLRKMSGHDIRDYLKEKRENG